MKPIKLIEAYRPLFDDRSPHYAKRYLVFHGGRGSGKTIHAAMACLHRGFYSKQKILCARQFQNSIKDSVHSTLERCIDDMGMRDHYEVTEKSIIGKNGTEFIFRGVHNNIQSIKSIDGVTICWIEEGSSVSEHSWEILIPTIRAEGSQFIVTFNSDLEKDPTYQRFIINPPSVDKCYVKKVNYDENPFFPQVLRDEMEYCKSVDLDAFRHIWEGEPRIHSAAQVFNGKWTFETFEPPANAEFMFGADWGFSVDPTAAVQCYAHDGNLYIYKESYTHRLDIDRTAEVFMSDIPGMEKYVCRGDNARPETISYLQRHGMPNMTGVDKWTGSVEDGIAAIRAFKKVIIHPSCTHTIDEFKLYSYKINKMTKDILPEVDDKNNHIIDALRYALQPMIQRSGAGMGYLQFMQTQVAKDRAEREPKFSQPVHTVANEGVVVQQDKNIIDYSALMARDRARLDED